MSEVVIIDAGPLVTAVNALDPGYAAVMSVLSDNSFRLVVSALCVAEASYLIARAHGALVEATFLEGLEAFEVVSPEPGEWSTMAQLARQYADFPLGAADASIMVLSQRFETDLILTLDHRHFRAVRPLHCEAFRLLP